MKTLVKITLILFVMYGFQSCSKNETPAPEPIAQPEPEPIAQNNPPNSFDLVAVTDNAVEVDVLPTFSWNAATDPDGDNVTYDLFLNLGTIAEQLFAEDSPNGFLPFVVAKHGVNFVQLSSGDLYRRTPNQYCN